VRAAHVWKAPLQDQSSITFWFFFAHAMPCQITLWTEFNMRQRTVFFKGVFNVSLPSKVALSPVARAGSATEGDRLRVLAAVLFERQGVMPRITIKTGAVSHQKAPL
tara:strand:- start:424 stop:744 length:321 start_codon:yes stop_codon:yes gene_type:complete